MYTLLLSKEAPTLILGVVFILIGLVLIVKPEVSLAPLSDDAGAAESLAPYWGRFVGIIWLLLGCILTYIGVWYTLNV